MPLIWRFLLRSFFKVFTLCIIGFITILLVTRFQNIARFAASGAPPWPILKFALFQIPHVLPIAIPISCLISSLLLFQQLNNKGELTTLRASGLGLFSIAYPLILSSLLIGIANFTIASEISPHCRTMSKHLIHEILSTNPLCLLQKESFIRTDDVFVDTQRLKWKQASNKSAKHSAQDLCLVLGSHANRHLSLVVAKDLSIEGNELIGRRVSLISTAPSKKDTEEEEGFDHLIIENQEEMRTEASLLSHYLYDTHLDLSYSRLSLRMLLAKANLLKDTSKPFPRTALVEIGRRVSLGLAPITFTVLGLAFGITQGRERKLKGVLSSVGLATFYLTAFMTARTFKSHPLPALFLFIASHFVLLLFSLLSLKKITEGRN